MREAFEVWNIREERELSVAFPRWMGHGACASGGDSRLDDFFAEDESSGMSTDQVYGAKYICLPCPVRPECLMMALRVEKGEAMTGDGIFGGLTPAERNFAWQAASPVAYGLQVLDQQATLGLVATPVPRWEEDTDVSSSGSF